jgi:hypothetical protein
LVIGKESGRDFKGTAVQSNLQNIFAAKFFRPGNRCSGFARRRNFLVIVDSTFTLATEFLLISK